MNSSTVGVIYIFPQTNFELLKQEYIFALTITKITKKISIIAQQNLNLLVTEPSVPCAETSWSVLDFWYSLWSKIVATLC